LQTPKTKSNGFQLFPEKKNAEKKSTIVNDKTTKYNRNNAAVKK